MLESYHTITILLLVLIVYFSTNLLVATRAISFCFQRRLWNFILAISFSISGFLGLILAILIDNQASVGWYRFMLWSHVEFGIVMAVVALIHFVWHFKYYFPNKGET